MVDLLNNGWTDKHQEGALLTEIQRRLEGEWDTHVVWCSRSADHVANLMVQHTLGVAEGIVFIS